MLLQSEHRTLDPEEADYFYIPVWWWEEAVSSGVSAVPGAVADALAAGSWRCDVL